MFAFTSVNNSKRWIQKCFAVIGIIACFCLLVYHQRDSPVVRASIESTLKQMKQVSLFGSSNNNESTTTIVVAPSFVNVPVTDPPTSFDALMRRRFNNRNTNRHDYCMTPAYEQNRKGIDIKKRIWTIAKGRVRYCHIPKVASTFMAGLNQAVLRKLNDTDYLDGKKSLIIVREPYSRLVSAYIGKIVTRISWQRNLGKSIVTRFRPLATAKSKSCGNDVTFPEFLKYFLEADTTGWKQDLHFTPIYKQCNPCSFPYDYQAHLETLKDDLAYILKSVNITVDMDFNNEEGTTRGKANEVVNVRDKITRCETMCSALSKVWWSFQARGLISKEISFPLKEERCNTINGTEFGDIAWDAHLQSIGRMDKSQQKREIMASLYLQAPLSDRLKVKDHLLKDFQLYGYDPLPKDLFPELDT